MSFLDFPIFPESALSRQRLHFPGKNGKGADKGIDGRLYFHEGGKGADTKQIILSVKAGKPTVSHLRDLRGVVDREGAQVGVLLLMHPPTKPMVTEAASAGFYTSPWGQHPRLQILTAAELMDGRSIDYPNPLYSNVTLRKAPKVEKPAGKQLPLLGGDD